MKAREVYNGCHNEYGRIDSYVKRDSLVAAKIYGYLLGKKSKGEDVLLPTVQEVLDVFESEDGMIKSQGYGVELKYDDYFNKVVLEISSLRVNDLKKVFYTIQVKNGQVKKMARCNVDAIGVSKKIDLETTKLYDEDKIANICNLLCDVDKNYCHSKVKTKKISL